MTALHGYPNVHATRSRRMNTASNSVYPPQSHGDEIQHALREWEAPMAVDVPPSRIDAPQWQDRDGNGRIIRKAAALPAIKPQAEIDDEDGIPSGAALVVMFSAVAVVVAIITAFDWLVGAV